MLPAPHTVQIKQVEPTLLGLTQQSAVFADANRSAVVGLDDVVNVAVVGLHLVDRRDLLAALGFVADGLLHRVRQVAKFDRLGIAQVDVPGFLDLVVVIVITVAITLVVVVVVVVVVIAVAISIVVVAGVVIAIIAI